GIVGHRVDASGPWQSPATSMVLARDRQRRKSTERGRPRRREGAEIIEPTPGHAPGLERGREAIVQPRPAPARFGARGEMAEPKPRPPRLARGAWGNGR